MCKKKSSFFVTAALVFSIFFMGGQKCRAEGDHLTLSEIVVTATKKRENVQKIPSSVSAVDDLTLEKANIKTLAEAATLMPNVHMKVTSSGNAIVIRGLSTLDTALYSPAGLYVDDVPYSMTYMQNLLLNNVERIEALRGPQGTLYGRNSESGVINIVRKLPENYFQTRLFSEYGNYNTYRGGASFSGPLVEDKLYFSADFLRYQTDGYIKNAYKGNDKSADNETSSGRGLFRWTPNDRLDLRLSLDISHADRGIGTMRLDTGPNKSPRFEVLSDAADSSKEKMSAPAFVAKYRGDKVEASLISSFMDYRYGFISDLDRTPRFIGISDMDLKQKDFNQEIRLSSIDDDKFSWTTGLFAARSSRDVNMARLRPRAAASSFLYTYAVEETWAIFGQGCYELVENLRLTGGLRAEHSRLKGDQTYKLGNTLRRDYQRKENNTELLPMVGLSWDAAPNVTLYATWGQGYLPGGFNYFAAENPETFYYEAEYSDNYEIGLKSNWFDNKMALNLSLFHTTVKDKQVREEDPNSGPGTWKFTNSAKAHSQGIELEMSALPLSGLEIRGGIGYTRSVVDEWQVNKKGKPYSYKGKKLPWAPDLTCNLGLGYTHESGWFGQTDLYWTGKQYFDAENTLSDSGAVLLNAKAGYIGDNWELSIWGKNILNDRYAVKKLQNAGNLIVEDGAPFTFGMTVAWSF